MKWFSQNRTASILGLMLLIISSDQVTKVWARTALLGNPKSFLGGRFRLELAENAGGFLSLGSQLQGPFRFWLLTVTVAIFLVVGLVYIFRKKSLTDLNTFAISVILAGGIANLIDRIQKGTVTDFLFLGWGPLRTGIFNIADMAIMLGLFLTLIAGWNERDAHKSPPQSFKA